MSKIAGLIFGVLGVLGGSLTAQQYRCDWSVNGIGGGDMASSAYRCGSTAGQTAIGQLDGTSYQAFIGFWQIDVPVGIREEVGGQAALPLVTRLYAPAPNPSRGRLTIRYSLAVQSQAKVELVDLGGRVVRTLVNSSQKPGRYSLCWNGMDSRGRLLANGVYFCHFRAGDFRATQKLVLQK
jgi:hypothetical protein